MASSEFKKMDKFRKKVFVSSGRLESAFIAVVEACQTRMALGISVNMDFPKCSNKKGHA